MRINIELDTDNAAFEEDFYGELNKILKQAIQKIYRQLERTSSLCEAPEAADKLLDSNGNTVGSLKVSRTEEGE